MLLIYKIYLLYLSILNIFIALNPTLIYAYFKSTLKLNNSTKLIIYAYFNF